MHELTCILLQVPGVVTLFVGMKLLPCAMGIVVRRCYCIERQQAIDLCVDFIFVYRVMVLLL